MCAGAILQVRIDTIVWGAPNKLLGANGSWIRIFLDGNEGDGRTALDNKPATLWQKLVAKMIYLEYICVPVMVLMSRHCRPLARTTLTCRPLMLSMLVIAAVYVCGALLFKNSPEVYVLKPFSWESLKYRVM